MRRSSSTGRVPGVLAVVSALALALPARARAVGEDERQLALLAGAARLDDGSAGLLGRIEGQFGLSDVLALHLALGASWHSRTGGTARATGLAAGVTYALDVLRVVPFFEGGLAIVDQRGGDRAARLDAGAEVGLGGEYLLDRRWAVALVGRFAYLPLPLSGSGGAASFLTLALRLGRMF
jgi:hypothetical protein